MYNRNDDILQSIKLISENFGVTIKNITFIDRITIKYSCEKIFNYELWVKEIFSICPDIVIRY